jgi:NitT/TauT family transport system ATP-binding protein
MSTEIAISAPYPRSEDFRVSPVYNDYCRRASEALREAIAQSRVEPD